MDRKKVSGEKHHSKAKGAIIGGALGRIAGGGRKSAAAGAVIGAERQHKKNKKEGYK